MSERVESLGVLQEAVSQAQLRACERHAEVAQARANLSQADVRFGEAIAELNKAINDLLYPPQAES